MLHPERWYTILVVIRDQQKLERRVLSLGRRLQQALDLHWLTINHKFSTVHTDDRITAETQADWTYRQATIIWNLPLVATMSDDTLETTMVHELVHILNASVWESLPDKVKDQIHPLNEFATENVARAIVAALRT